MRNWSFLAMQEITDVTLPSAAPACRQWYRDHGAEQMAEFQSIPEWQVSGDEQVATHPVLLTAYQRHGFCIVVRHAVNQQGKRIHPGLLRERSGHKSKR